MAGTSRLMESVGVETRVAEEKETGRVEAFSDGVFAIAITLLVLDIKVPQLESIEEGGLLEALRKQWPSYLAFACSFLTILIMWINHHNFMKLIKRVDHSFLILNGLLLMGITLVPFPTALISEHLLGTEGWLAAAIYVGLSLMIAIFFNVLWFYSSRRGRLLGRGSDTVLAARTSRRYAIGPTLYLVAFVLAFVSPLASIGVCIGLGLFFAWPNNQARTLSKLPSSVTQADDLTQR